jgi:[ribosomal protein S18]-alanine N-acetyltransferase
MLIRRLAAGDLDAVMVLAAGVPEAPRWARASYEHALIVPDIDTPQASNLRQAAWVADEGMVVVGFVVVRMVLDACEIESIAVAEEVRRRGVGGALIEAAISWAMGLGARRIELEVRAGNETAIRFYEGMGLFREGQRRGYYRNPDEDAVLMAKRLESGAKTVENFRQKSD